MQGIAKSIDHRTLRSVVSIGAASHAEFEPGATKSEPTVRGASSAARLRATHAAAQCDRWFRRQVQESIDDPRPNVPHDQVMAQAQALIDAKSKTHGEHGRKTRA